MTVGEFFGKYQPTAALAMIAGGYLARSVAPDLTTGVVCEQWQLGVSRANSSAAPSSAPVRLVLAEGCPSGTMWLSEVQRDNATMTAATTMMADTLSNFTSVMAVGDVNATALAASLAAQTPKLFLVIIDSYVFGGGSCTNLPASLVDTSTCAPLVVGACDTEEFAADTKRHVITCNPYEALSDSVAEQLRQAPMLIAAPPGAPPPPPVLSCASVTRGESSSAPFNPLFILAIVLPIVAVVLLVAGIIAVCIVRSKRKRTDTNVKVAIDDKAAPPAKRASAADIRDDWAPED